MFDTSTFVPLYYQLILHIKSQIRSVGLVGTQVSSDSGFGESFILRARQYIKPRVSLVQPNIHLKF